ncbi:MAG: N-acetylglucosamine-6-phosphate deacetylase [Candidatus Bipolaricaulaceae bacterium]
MAELLIRGGRLVLGDAVQEGDCLVQAGKVAGVGRIPRRAGGQAVLEAAGNYVAPGFVDLHVHGGAGSDFMDATPHAHRTVFAFHARHGTTAMLTTLLPAPLETMQRALRMVAELRAPWALGAYLEGPFVSKAKKGAFDPRWLVHPSPEAFRELVQGQQAVVKVMTLAPELPGAQSLVHEIVAAGALPSIGHTAATYEEATAAVGWGSRGFTHLFNAMRGLHHREPGAVGAALDSDAYVELICDGVHVHPAAVRLVARVKGFDRICLITDAVSAAGLADGDYELGGLKVLARGGVARLEDGTLAGSTLTLERAVRNFMEFTGCSLPQAIRCATLTPARLLGVDHHKGSLEVGKDADLVVLDDELRVRYTIVGGEVVYAVDREE